MDSPFAYSKPVTGRNFYGRKTEALKIRDMISQGGSVAVYGPMKCGKMSLVQESLYQLKLSKTLFKVAEVDLLDVRDFITFLLRTCTACIRAFDTTPSEFEQTVGAYFSDTHVVFDQLKYSRDDAILSFGGTPDAGDVTALLKFPYALASGKGVRLVVILREFQNLMLTEGWEMQMKAMEVILRQQREAGGCMCSWIMTGSQLNAMKQIFEHTKYFHRQVQLFNLGSVDTKEIVERVMKGFLSSGKVVDRAQVERVCRLFKGNIWYINHFISICDHISRGYIMESVLLEALDTLLAIHRIRFESTMNDLTVFQTRLLKAIAEGRTRLSAADVVRDYSLNSSANVNRIKDALMKKEIITFDADDNPQITDPLFEYWVKKYFFHMRVDFK